VAFLGKRGGEASKYRGDRILVQKTAQTARQAELGEGKKKKKLVVGKEDVTGQNAHKPKNVLPKCEGEKGGTASGFRKRSHDRDRHQR